MESALGGFEKEELLRVKAGHITQETHRNKIRTLRKHLIPFLESKYVVQTNQIRPDSFQDYALWRANASPLSINREIVQIRDFLRNYLVRHRLMPENERVGGFLSHLQRMAGVQTLGQM